MKCVWTGQEFEPSIRGGHDKKFASSIARAQAHKAARLYTEALIADGYLTWEAVRHWYNKLEQAEIAYKHLFPNQLPTAGSPKALEGDQR